MRKICFAGLAFAAILSLSCTKEELRAPSEREELQSISFSASLEALKNQTDVKSYISEWSSRAQSWARGDSISLFSGGVNHRFDNTLDDGPVAKFEGEASPAASYVAVYPYQSGAAVSDGNVTFTLPAEQKADAHGTDPAALVKVASTANGNLIFRNVFSLVKFTITDTDVTKIIVEGNNGEILAGKICVTPGNEPAWTVVKGEKTVVLDSPDGSSFAAGDYAVAVLPQTFSKGIRLILKKEGQVKCSVKSTPSEIEAARSAGIAVPASVFESVAYKYYYIMNKADLDAFFGDLDSWASTDVAYLGADIDYGKASRAHNRGTFTGTFDGRYHRIYNIYGSGANMRAGFFYQLNGTMKNVCFGSSDYDFSKGSAADAGTYDGYSHYKITGCAASGSTNQWYYAGAVAYLYTGGRMENVVNFCEIRSVPTSFGSAPYCYRAAGIAGTMKGNTTITGCTNYGKVYNNDKNASVGSTSLQIAGIVSINDGDGASVTNCVNRGQIVNNNPKIPSCAGIIGQLSKGMTLSGCTNYGSISDSSDGATSTRYVGGIVGTSTASGVTVTNCANYGPVGVDGPSSGSVAVGGIMGYNSTSTAVISACHNYEGGEIHVSSNAIEGNTSASYFCAGGILGWTAIAMNVSSCDNEAPVTMTGTPNAASDIRFGGIIGSTGKGGSLTGCTNTGDVTLSSAHTHLVRLGGVIGSCTGAAVNITDCHCDDVLVSASVTSGATLATLQLSGVCGYQGTGSPTIKDCSSSATLVKNGSVTLSKLYQVLSHTPSGGTTTIQGCKITGSVDGTAVTKNNYTLYICPTDYEGTVSLSGCGSGTFVLSDTEVKFSSLGGVKEIELTADKDWTVSSSESWLTVSPSAGTASATAVTVTLTAGEYSQATPRTATVTFSAGGEDKATVSVTQTAGDMFEGAGTQANPFKMTRASHFKTLASFINADSETAGPYKSAYYVMENDIDFSGVDDYVPVGNSEDNGFCGKFDGQNHTVSNFSCNGSACGIGGLFGYCGTGSEIRNIRFSNPDVSSNRQVGVVAGWLSGGTIDNCSVEGGSVFSSGNVTINGLGISCTGGIVGRSFKGVVSGCTFGGTVVTTANQSAGICGFCDCSTISGCRVAQGSDITSAYYTGGIVAKMLSTVNGFKSTVTDCVFEGTVLVKNWGCGGIVGNMNGGTVKNCVLAGCGEVKANNYYCGGIVGIVNTTTGGIGTEATIDNCAAYGSVQGGYDCAAILGYSSYPSGYTLNVVNCAGLCYEVMSKSNNGGSNQYALLGSISGYSTGAGTTNIVNCYGKAGVLTSISESNGGIACVVGYFSPTTGLVDNCFTPMTAGDIISRNAPISSSSITKWGAIVGRSASAGSTFKRCYYNEGVQFGTVDSGTKDSSCEGVSVAAMSDGTLLAQLNGNLSSLTAISGVTFSSWVAGTDGTPVLSTVPADPKPAVLASKKVSIIGDSISTFAGFSLPSYSIHYPNASCDVLSVNQTWWHRLIYEKMSGARLDTNNSFGNTTVTRNTRGDSSQYWYGYDFCSRFITCAGVGSPDVIIIHGGTNDYGHNTGEELYTGIAMRSETAPTASQMQTLFDLADAATTVSQSEALGSDTFAESYLKLVRMCQVRYPGVKVVCLVGDCLGKGMGEVVKMIADHCGARYVDFLGTYGYHDNTYVTKYDGTTHPDANGMQHMADFIYSTVGSWID